MKTYKKRIVDFDSHRYDIGIPESDACNNSDLKECVSVLNAVVSGRFAVGILFSLPVQISLMHCDRHNDLSSFSRAIIAGNFRFPLSFLIEWQTLSVQRPYYFQPKTHLISFVQAVDRLAFLLFQFGSIPTENL